MWNQIERNAVCFWDIVKNWKTQIWTTHLQLIHYEANRYVSLPNPILWENNRHIFAVSIVFKGQWRW